MVYKTKRNKASASHIRTGGEGYSFRIEKKGEKMKKLLVAVMTLVCSAGIVSNGVAVIVGSAHDFTAEGSGISTDQICLPCHAPHNGSVTLNAPLWNHTLSTETYTMYTSATLDADLDNEPGGVSKLCLSCHDGTVALDSFGGATGTNMLTGDANVGTNLANDHPISFTYDDTLAGVDGGLFLPDSGTTALGGTISNDLLFANKMECASCHDVHNKYEQDSLLVMSNVGSALCLTCHDK